jgi:hypothetical protein
MPGCKALDIMRNEAYFPDVAVIPLQREWVQRSPSAKLRTVSLSNGRWAFMNSLLIHNLNV